MIKFKAIKNSYGPGWHVVDTETGRNVNVAWIYDQEHGKKYPEADEARAKMLADALNDTSEVELLRDAIIKTLDDNAHLADGESCTLIALKEVLREIGCPWDGDEIKGEDEK